MSNPTGHHPQPPRISIHLHIDPTLLSHTHQVHASSSTPLLTITSTTPVEINLILEDKIVERRLESRHSRSEIVQDRSVESDGNVGREEQDVEEWGDEEYNALFAWLRQARKERRSVDCPDPDFDSGFNTDGDGYEYEVDDNYERETKRRNSLNLEPNFNTKTLAQEFDALELDADDQALVEEWGRLIVEESEKSMSMAEELEELDLNRGGWDLVRMWRGNGRFEIEDDDDDDDDDEIDFNIGYYGGWSL